MKLNFPVIHFIVLAFGWTACSPRYSYFTQELYQHYNWSEEELSNIQFFVSRDIVLERSLQSGETVIEGGSILVRDGKRIEQVHIKAGTPGVLVFMPAEDRFAVSFEPKSNEAYLMFGPNPDYENRFALLAREWEKEYGIVHYNEQEYTVHASSAFAGLMVDLKRYEDRQVDTRTLSGRTITD